MELTNILCHVVSNSVRAAIKLGGLDTTGMHFSQFWRQGNPRSSHWQAQYLVRTSFLVIDGCLLPMSLRVVRERTVLWALLINKGTRSSHEAFALMA